MYLNFVPGVPEMLQRCVRGSFVPNVSEVCFFPDVSEVCPSLWFSLCLSLCVPGVPEMCIGRLPNVRLLQGILYVKQPYTAIYKILLERSLLNRKDFLIVKLCSLFR
jgi:hypothetical protein